MLKLYKLTLVVITTACFLQGCIDNSFDFFDQDYTYVKLYGGVGQNDVAGFYVTSQNEIYLATSTTDTAIQQTAMLYKLNSRGDVIWTRNVTNAPSPTFSSAITYTSNEEIVIAAHDVSIRTCYLTKYDRQGEVLWSYTYSSDTSEIIIKSIIETFNNQIIIAYDETLMSESITERIIIEKLDNQGNQVWSKKFELPQSTSLSCEKLLDLGIGQYAFVWNRMNGGDFDVQCTVINEEGGILWNRTLPLLTDNAQIRNDQQAADMVKFGNSLIIAGHSNRESITNAQIHLMQVSYLGQPIADIQLQLEWGGEDDETATSMLQPDLNHVVVGGSTRSDTNGEADMYLSKCNLNTGEVVWEENYGFTGNDRIVDIAQAKNGGFYACGTVTFENRQMICLIKTDAEGKVWE